MYTPPAFKEDRPEVLRGLIARHPLATLVTVGQDGPMANLVPFVLEMTPAGDVLRAHLARANDQLPSLRAGGDALVIFQGPEAYITPSWHGRLQRIPSPISEQLRTPVFRDISAT
jgi:transcriptional regulator